MKTEHLSLRIEAGLLTRLRKAAASPTGPNQSKIVSWGIELALNELERRADGHTTHSSKKGK